jgi:hypothetical protein
MVSFWCYRERRTICMAIPGMQKANPGGLAKCKN